jgi:hypothetical protein
VSIAPGRLLTIGYQGRSLADLVQRLVANDVQLLLDLRRVARSRRPEFNRDRQYLDSVSGMDGEAVTRASGTEASSSPQVATLMGGTKRIYNRHSTWDCCGLETTYVDHAHSYTWDGVYSYVSNPVTAAWWREFTYWYLTAGPNVWYNTSNPGTSVSTEGNASFDNDDFPCDCQPCAHTLYSEVRSYGSGAWTRSSSYWSAGYPQICSGYIHTSSTWGER